MGLSDLILAILEKTIANQISNELKAWTPWMVDRMIKRAVQHVPEGMRERMNEEWHSHVAEVPGEVAKLATAFGFIRASRRMGDTAPIVDRLFGFVFLVLFLPVLLAMLVALKLESPREATAFRRKVVFGGRECMMLELRSTGRFGKFLERTSLNALPYLVNIMRGDVRVPWAELPAICRQILFTRSNRSGKS